MTGAELRTVFASALQRAPNQPGISGIRVRADCKAGALVVTMLRPSGKPIHDDERLLVSTMDFVATGGDGILSPVLPPDGFKVTTDGSLARDHLADWLRERGGHLREADLVDTANPRMQFSGTAPIDCRSQRF